MIKVPNMGKSKDDATKPSGSGNMSASSSLDPSVVFQGTAAPPNPTVPKKKGGIRSRFTLQRLLYSPLLNRRRKSSAAKSTQSKSSAKPSASKTSFEESYCQMRYGSVGQNGAGASSMACDSLSAASFSSSSGDQKSEKVPGGQECPMCLSYCRPDKLLTLTGCHHVACKTCLTRYVIMSITEHQGNVHCFECSEFMHPSDVQALVIKPLVIKYEDFMLRRVLAGDPDARWCPAPDCSFAVIAAGCASCPKLKCKRPGCGMQFCYHCKAEWHPNQTCDAARAEREPRFRSSSLSFSYDIPFQKEQIKPCPVCRSLIMKQEDGSCNHMVCSVCSTEFCWLCMKQISDLHYLSPSGCTFWGKKPWSRKKKIMWQLGMLIGAPLGIALIAGIAVPAIVIGIPVLVGRRIYRNTEYPSGYKRNMLIFGGVVASVFVSPVLAGAAVGFGVPMLLAYVYGVVPVSLCRSGVCGISTSASGVRLDFDEAEDGISGRLAAMGDEIRRKSEEEDDTDGRLPSGANEMMAEGSSVVGMSMTLSLGDGSSCHTVDRHDETASLTALAGSIASSASRGQRMEVLADVTSHVGKRNSVSSESVSAVVSMISSDRHSDARSGVVAVSDDRASNVALAGSVLSYRDKFFMSHEIPYEVKSTEESKLNDEVSWKGNLDLSFKIRKPELLSSEQGHHGEAVSLKSVDATGPHGGAHGTNASVSPVSSFSTGDEIFFGRRSVTRGSARKGFLDRQLSLDSGSLEERVRFDENVSFIDDHGDGQILEDVEAEELEARRQFSPSGGSNHADLEDLIVRMICDKGLDPCVDNDDETTTTDESVHAKVNRQKHGSGP
ncbi:unnamed protein product [Notodromas monacha]|uniref:RBR-type E3 ubiquitin transferase n=1 Tax=Notodromas monacha TaxID=399045 RepID=A0A7R9BWJ4_9CRUS|nr:unnamed protein product [Notodromas monacha]CAG0923100.1 unnamed protein product [Notodromas monacha]